MNNPRQEPQYTEEELRRSLVSVLGYWQEEAKNAKGLVPTERIHEIMDWLDEWGMHASEYEVDLDV